MLQNFNFLHVKFIHRKNIGSKNKIPPNIVVTGNICPYISSFNQYSVITFYVCSNDCLINYSLLMNAWYSTTQSIYKENYVLHKGPIQNKSWKSSKTLESIIILKASNRIYIDFDTPKMVFWSIWQDSGVNPSCF